MTAAGASPRDAGGPSTEGPARRNALLVVLVTVLVAGCQGSGASESGPGAAGPTPAARPTVHVAAGPGWHGGTVDGPVPLPGACHYVVDGAIQMQDRSCTPGAVDSAVTQANLHQTLCRPGGYTASVRPPQEVTDAYKRLARQAYSSPGASSDFELDHLVPLGLGGASSAANLWPERNTGDPKDYDSRSTGGTNAKDGVESRLNRAVCAGEVTLAAAQNAVAENWATAEQVLGVRP